MPNLKQHLAIGAVAGAGTYLAMCHYYERKPCWGEALTCVGVGLVGGALPDALEPAVHPNHRAICHSLALGTGMTKIALAKCSRANGVWDEFDKILVAVAVVSYLSHLVADGCTPKGLPILHK